MEICPSGGGYRAMLFHANRQAIRIADAETAMAPSLVARPKNALLDLNTASN
jgi:hypothetical protein